ncbi:MAG: hypothetical protein JO022_13640, partial [Acidobacteriaceae bacterium]|nr:hypothetical protein [Acidobacteriaceae bacterium]
MKDISRVREGERGYAVLMVFVLSACIAITLYNEIPRVAFEAQRGREQLLVDRGDQYKRAIQIFVRKNKRYPASIDELESYQNVRSLRHRYKDPMTGKDEWRLVHVGPGGQLTDSLVQKQQNPLAGNGTGNNQAQGSTGPGGIQNTGLTNPGFNSGQTSQNGTDGQPGTNGQPPVNANGVAEGTGGINFALARRPSDRTPGGAQAAPAPPTDAVDPSAGAPPLPQPTDPNQPAPGTQPAPPTVAGGGFQPVPGQQGQPQPGQVPQPWQPGQPIQNGQPGQPTQQVPAGGVFMSG